MNVDTGEFRALSERAAAADARRERRHDARRAPGSGSRGRSRELGYADGMLEMTRLLSDGGDYWRAAELEEAGRGYMEAAALMGKIGAWLDRYASYAFRAWELHQSYRGTFARDVEHLAYLEREGYASAPRRELPQREQSENN